MIIDFRNVNALWSSVLAETLLRLGVTTAVICPGSRSGPLAVAFAQHPEIEAIPILDERSAAFFALGRGKITGVPSALVCTSGTAGANFYPAVIEARESGVPLLVLTADRPPELRHCHSGQAIDQQRLYGNYPAWQAELGLPSEDMNQLRYLRQTLVQAIARSRFPSPAAVHLNVPFRDPLAPVASPVQRSLSEFDGFFAHLVPPITPTVEQPLPWETWRNCDRGLIIAGVDQPLDPEGYCCAIAHLSNLLGWVVLAEGLSPVRNHAHLVPNLVSTYDFILRESSVLHRETTERGSQASEPSSDDDPLPADDRWSESAIGLTPEMVIQIGAFPTSKNLRTWLDRISPLSWVLETSGENLDPLHRSTIPLRSTLSNIFQLNDAFPPLSAYQKQWLALEEETRDKLDQKLANTRELIEPKIAWFLSQTLPEKTPLFIANSLPVRDVEWFWQPNSRQVYPLFNRGANGIDGTLSTALGMAHQGKSAVCLTGDLALLHDSNGFLASKQVRGHLTIVLVNNQGGGIFEMLPISQFSDVFEDYFATPQAINFSALCATYGIKYNLITNWEQFGALLNPLPKTGIRLLEIQTNRFQSKQWREISN